MAYLQGRVAATISFAGLGMSPIAALLSGLHADHHGPRAALLIRASVMDWGRPDLRHVRYGAPLTTSRSERSRVVVV